MSIVSAYDDGSWKDLRYQDMQGIIYPERKYKSG